MPTSLRRSNRQWMWKAVIVAIIITCCFVILDTHIASPEKRNTNIQRHVKLTCDKLNVSYPVNDFMLAHMHVDHHRKTLYCYVPKVACTSWKRVWLKLTGVVPPERDIGKLDRYFIHTSLPTLAGQKDRVLEVMGSYKKFMFVRHPFDRVLSAFKDKLENHDKESSYDFHKEIGAQIELKYRGNSTGGHNISFAEFINFISEPKANHGTFEQRNEHWLPIHEVCNPCVVSYDFIGKYEHLKEDSEHVLSWMGAREMVPNFPAADRSFNVQRYDPRYFNQLTNDLKKDFFFKYAEDFLAFDYEFV